MATKIVAGAYALGRRVARAARRLSEAVANVMSVAILSVIYLTVAGVFAAILALTRLGRRKRSDTMWSERPD